MPELLKLSGTTSASFEASNANSPLNICDVPAIIGGIHGYDELEKNYCLGFEFQLESLKAAVDLRNSLGQAPFPNIKASDETPVRLSKFAEIISGYPKLGVEIVKDDHKIGGFDLQNRGMILDVEMRYPFLGTGYVKLLGTNNRLKVKLHDYGDGLLKGGKDYIAIEGDYTLTIHGVEKKSSTLKIPNESTSLSIAELKELDIVNFSSGTLSLKPYNLELAILISNKFPWIKAWNFFNASFLPTLKGLGDLTNPIVYLDLYNCMNLKDISDLTLINSLEWLRLDRVDCSQFDMASVIVANPRNYYFSARQCSLTTNQVDEILITFDSSKSQRMDFFNPASFTIELRSNQAASTNGINAANNLRASGWKVYHD